MTKPELIEVLRERVLVLDGAMGTGIHARRLPLSDYEGHENCVDVVTASRPDIVRDIHRSYLAVGCDAVMTNTFGANKIVLSDFGIAERTYALNKQAAEIACEVCREFNRPKQPRYVIGSMGPGTRLPTLGQTTWDTILESYTEQARGLLEDWDVLNEPYTNHQVQDILGDAEMAAWFQAAKESDPEARLFINDYSILSANGADFAATTIKRKRSRISSRSCDSAGQ